MSFVFLTSGSSVNNFFSECTPQKGVPKKKNGGPQRPPMRSECTPLVGVPTNARSPMCARTVQDETTVTVLLFSAYCANTPILLCARVCRGAPVENHAEMPARKGVSVPSDWKSDGGTTVPPFLRGLPEILERV